MHILHVVGARPNFMKVAPVMRALDEHQGVRQTLVHTGQHYDANMSEIFFRQLELPEPHVNLEVGSGSQAFQTAQIMMRFEEVVLREKPEWVLVYGDVNSTVASALVCAKMGTPVAHVEAGLRSRDRSMPEEINRLLTDQLADLLFTPSPDGDENLQREGIPREKIHFVGNVMIDTLVRLLPKAQLPALPYLNAPYALVTLHRPSNVDDPKSLMQIIEALSSVGRELQVVFPMHPRTRQRIADFGIDLESYEGFRVMDPVGYLEFLAMQRQARVVITDSGGIQEETTYLGIPCLTLRENTERPVTLTEGTNTIIGRDMDFLKRRLEDILAGEVPTRSVPRFWDGQAGRRIAEVLCKK